MRIQLTSQTCEVGSLKVHISLSTVFVKEHRFYND